MLSVVVPTLNEASCVGRAVASAWAAGAGEVVVVDGGSADATVDAARGAGATVVEAPRGRAAQMNAGAARATGDVLVFLHADTVLPEAAGAAVSLALETGAEAGVFRLAFDRPTHLLRLYAAATRLPWRLLAFGDRALWVRRGVFEALGGFPAWPVYEDLELARRLAERGRFRYLPFAVTTSARRFERNGPLRQQAHNLRLWLHYVWGTPADAVAGRYGYGPERG